MKHYVDIDTQIQNGYDYLLKRQNKKCCEEWLSAWSGIKMLFQETGAKDIFELDKVYPWTDFISNYAQELEAELHNAGLDDAIYHQKRIEYCQELLGYCSEDKLITENTRRAIAESYAELGDYNECDTLFSGWLQTDPNWGWGYIGWSDCYLFSSKLKNHERVEQILLQGLAQPHLCDRADVVERMVTLYEHKKDSEKVRIYKKQLKDLKRQSVKAIKVGRNDPCPCSSGKKYKRCCGA